MTKNAILYARVSTDEQAEHGYSLPSQLQAGRDYAERNGLTVCAEISDDYTGTRLNRPGLTRARDMLEQSTAQAIVVFSTDRLTRNLAHLLILREEWLSLGVELHFCNRGKSEDTPEARFSENIEGVFNEYWRERIIENSRRGTYSKARAGKVVGRGRSPYGYRYENDAFVIVEKQAEIVRLIYKLYAQGINGGEPLTDNAIAHYLSKQRIPTPLEDWGIPNTRKRKAGMWDDVTISKILKNETYAGTWHYGKRDKGQWRPQSEWIPVAVPALVERETWEAAQNRRVYNKRMSPRNVKHKYLLRGHIRCSCGSAMVGTNRGKSYRCNARSNHYVDLEPPTCTAPSVSRPALDAAIWTTIIDFLTDPEKRDAHLQAACAAASQARQDYNERLSAVECAVSVCERDAASLVAMMLKSSDGGIISRALQRRIDEVEGRYQSLLAEQHKLRLEIEQHQDLPVQSKDVFQNDVLSGIALATFDDKRRVLSLLDARVTVGENEVKISIGLPISLKRQVRITIYLIRKADSQK